MATDPHWTAYLTAFATPVVAVMAVMIAFRQVKIAAFQARTARNKLKLDLFDRRSAVYAAAMRAMSQALMNGQLDEAQQVDYHTCIGPARWLFGADIWTYLNNTLWGVFVDLEFYNKHPPGSYAVQRAEKLKWLLKEHRGLGKMFEEYLTLEH